MAETIKVCDKETAKKGIIAIGQELIKRAEDITNDIEQVTSITISAKLNPLEIVNFNVTKNYTAIIEDKENKGA